MLRLRIPKCVITEAPIHVRISPIGNALGKGLGQELEKIMDTTIVC